MRAGLIENGLLALNRVHPHALLHLGGVPMRAYRRLKLLRLAGGVLAMAIVAGFAPEASAQKAGPVRIPNRRPYMPMKPIVPNDQVRPFPANTNGDFPNAAFPLFPKSSGSSGTSGTSGV